jgi:hypothetical protein
LSALDLVEIKGKSAKASQVGAVCPGPDLNRHDLAVEGV